MHDLANIVDHTLLKPEATAADLRALVAEADELGTFSVCVSPSKVVYVREAIPAESRLKVAAVVGFPSGAHRSEVKALEARLAVEDGADEIDMVIKLSAALAGRTDLVEEDIRAVREAIPRAILKVIIESAALTDEQIVAVCQAVERADADFVKTSTGYHPAGGASVHAVELIRATVGDRLGVKASGGIGTRSKAEAMVAAGADRLGLSGTRAVLEGAPTAGIAVVGAY
ncbi:MAG: deoxyribose-phosphate aldolase [Microbacteriaceae bacterium]|nr:deoxyribose-phosphate aldolase [Microbacteriaceae bacterium]